LRIIKREPRGEERRGGEAESKSRDEGGERVDEVGQRPESI
tara:strand:+ start:329 stop:451 length:123 start_codon:yes stop_codon:yes gene_type:complete